MTRKPTKPVLSTAEDFETYHRYAGTKPSDREAVEEMVQEHLSYLAETLAGGMAAIKGDSYGYRPAGKSLRKWVASDGSPVKTASLLGALCHALGYGVADIEIYGCWELDSGWFIIPNWMAKSQQSFESNR